MSYLKTYSPYAR